MTLLLPFAIALLSKSEPVRPTQLKPLNERQMSWWRDAKFGMFIHWGVYAIPGKGEWYMNSAHVPVDEYRKLGDQFEPKFCDPNRWIQIAKSAGMKYTVLTARHHDGYALWNSPSSIDRFTSTAMAAKRDFIRDYVIACRKNRMPVGLYYSLMDWRIPGYYKPHELPESAQALKDQCYGQVRELTRNYGPIDILWYDGGWLNMHGTDADAAWLWEPDKLNSLVRKANLRTVINPRSGWGGDFDCEEGGSEVTGRIRTRPWEKCLNLNQTTWGYNPIQNLMSTNEVLTMLINTAVRDGNMLLNVGPDPDGVIPPTHAARLREVGQWLKKYGESIYGTRGGPLQPVDHQYGTTYHGKSIYVHCFGARDGVTIGLPHIDARILKSTLLTGGKAEVEQSAFAITIRLSRLTQTTPDTIVRFDCDREIGR